LPLSFISVIETSLLRIEPLCFASENSQHSHVCVREIPETDCCFAHIA